eukprot:4618193-Prymnesium_polylepis.2
MIALAIGGPRGGGGRAPRAARDDADADDDGNGPGTCIICMDRPKAATLVHGGTGHSAHGRPRHSTPTRENGSSP